MLRRLFFARNIKALAVARAEYELDHISGRFGMEGKMCQEELEKYIRLRERFIFLLLPGNGKPPGGGRFVSGHFSENV